MRHIMINWARQRPVSSVVAEIPEVGPAAWYDHAMTDQMRASVAAEAFASLPERWRMVLWHLEVEGETPAEVAPLLWLTPNGVSALAYGPGRGCGKPTWSSPCPPRAAGTARLPPPISRVGPQRVVGPQGRPDHTSFRPVPGLPAVGRRPAAAQPPVAGGDRAIGSGRPVRPGLPGNVGRLDYCAGRCSPGRGCRRHQRGHRLLAGHGENRRGRRGYCHLRSSRHGHRHPTTRPGRRPHRPIDPHSAPAHQPAANAPQPERTRTSPR